MADGALSGIRVLDFSHHVSGPYCTKLLADFGADVIKVERPDGGDPARRLGPFPDDVPHSEKSGLFLYLNTNKRGITVNLASEDGRGVIHRLLNEADVIVESFRPGAMARFGLDYEWARAAKPDLVYVSISSFGQTGPYRDFEASEIVLYAMGGEMFATGLVDREPVKLGPNVVLSQGGAAAAVGTLGAIFGAQAQGVGQHVDVSLMETQAGTIDRRMATAIAYQYCGEVQGRQALGGSAYPQGVYPCADGYFELVGGLIRWAQVVRMLGSPPELLDPKWTQPLAQQDLDLRAEFEAIFIPWVMERTKRELWEAAQAEGVLSAPLNTMDDVLNDAYFREREFFTQVEHPVAGTITCPGAPWLMPETPWEVRRPAPQLGEHNAEVLGSLGYGPEDVARLREQGAI